MKTRISLVLLALAATLLLAATAGASTRSISRTAATTFFGQSIPPVGTELTNVALFKDPATGQPKAVAKSIKVTADANGVLTAQVALEAGSGSSLDATLTWENECHWQLSVAANSAPGAPSTNATAVNLDHVSGSIKNIGCAMHVNMLLTGYVLGNSTFNVTLYANKGGFEGSTEVNNLVLGGTTYPHVKISLSTLSPKVHLQGTMKSSIGTFTTDSYVSAPNGAYELQLHVTGADLEFKTATFQITAFHFKLNTSIPASGNASYVVSSATAGGTLVMKKTTYTLHDISLKMVGGEVTEFGFKIHIRHEKSPTEIYDGMLEMRLDGDGGTFEELTQGRNDNGWQLAKAEKAYSRALLGHVLLAKTRVISKKYKDKRFKRTVTIGLTFGVSVYKPASAKASFAKASSSGYQAYIGAGGFFDADRISGGFGCTFATESTNFSCLGTIRVNPAWAGVYRYTWEV